MADDNHNLTGSDSTTEQKATNITWHQSLLSKQDRERLLNQKGVVIWFTGLSKSRKSPIAHAVEEELFKQGHLCYDLDRNNIRYGLKFQFTRKGFWALLGPALTSYFD